MRSRSAQFKLIADFLQPRSKRFNLLLLVRDLCLELLLLLSDGRFLLRRSGLQVLNCTVLFEEFVEQHRIHRVVANRIDPAFIVGYHQVGVCLGHFLGNQTKLRRASAVTFVVKRYRLERQDRFAGPFHRLNLVLEPARRASRAELAEVGHNDWRRGGALGSYTVNVADPGGAADVITAVTDSDNVTGRADSDAGLIVYCDVVSAGAGRERSKALFYARVVSVRSRAKSASLGAQ